MNEHEMQDFEAQIRQIARGFAYPPTPPSRPIQPMPQPARLALRLGLALVAVILILGAALWAVPAVRAVVLRVLRIGAIEIIVPPPTRTSELARTTSPTQTPGPTVTIAVTAQPTDVVTLPTTPTLHPQSIAESLNLFGKTTLKQARASGIRIKIPTALGEPDAVYLQDVGGKVAVLVWFDMATPGRVRMSLQIFANDVTAQKFPPRVLVETQVKHKPAAWVEGVHLLQIKNGNYDMVQLVSQHALIWTEGSYTYRLETDVSMVEAIKIANTTP